jgi:hypothetical protein
MYEFAKNGKSLRAIEVTPMKRACQAKVQKYHHPSSVHRGEAYSAQCSRAAKDDSDLCGQHAKMEATGYWIIRMGNVMPAHRVD